MHRQYTSIRKYCHSLSFDQLIICVAVKEKEEALKLFDVYREEEAYEICEEDFLQFFFPHFG